MNRDFRKIDLKLIKASEVITKLKTKYLSEPSIYADIHKIDERLEEISKIVKNDNSK